MNDLINIKISSVVDIMARIPHFLLGSSTFLFLYCLKTHTNILMHTYTRIHTHTYDGIFRLNLPANAEIIGFVDDMAKVLVVKTIPQIEALCNQVVDMVDNWLNVALWLHKRQKPY